MNSTTSVLSALLNILKISVTNTTIKKIDSDHEADTMLGLSDVLASFNIETLPVKIGVNQLQKIPYPAVAHLRKNSGYFVVLKKWENDLLHYFDPEIGWVKESAFEFEKKWTGVLLLVETTEKSGEEDYKGRRKAELFEMFSRYTAWALLAVALLVVLAFISITILPLYFLKIIGTALCLALLLKQFGGGDTLNAFCRMGSKTDCDAVIHSPASRLFGLVHLSEVGILYFVGGLLSIIIATVSGLNLTSVLAAFSIASLPFSFYSIYYQWQVVKKWCPLCVAVIGIIWLECLVGLLFVPAFSFLSIGIYSSFLSFTIPIVFWLSIRTRLIESFRIIALEKNLIRFKKNEHVFRTIMSAQPVVETGNFENETRFGDAETPFEITLVSNPTCGPCAHAHKTLEAFPELFKNKVSIKHRFMVGPVKNNSVSHQMLTHLFSLELSGQESDFRTALSSWFYASEKAEVGKWINAFPLQKEVDQAKVQEVINQHHLWCRESGITATPVVFINNKKLPEEFSIQDLKFQIRRMVKQLPVIVRRSSPNVSPLEEL